MTDIHALAAKGDVDSIQTMLESNKRAVKAKDEVCDAHLHPVSVSRFAHA